jgi:hypothetical protein
MVSKISVHGSFALIFLGQSETEHHGGEHVEDQSCSLHDGQEAGRKIGRGQREDIP